MPITEILSEDQRRKRVWRRVQHLAAFVLLMIIALTLMFEYRSGRMDTHQHWIENYGEKLMDNYEAILIQALQDTNQKSKTNNNNKNLNKTVGLAIETLRKQPVVIEASLFDASGAPVLKQMEVPAAQLLNHYSSSSPQIFIRELFAPVVAIGEETEENHQQLGYLRITLDRQFIIKQNAKISQSKWHLMLMISIVALVAGISIGRRLTQWRLKMGRL